jgi:hypothetical protein
MCEASPGVRPEVPEKLIREPKTIYPPVAGSTSTPTRPETVALVPEVQSPSTVTTMFRVAV